MAVDIENPNYRQNSICAIGIILVRDNKPILKEYSLINPEDSFDRINVNITGITPSMVKDKPTFEEYWPTISKLLEENIVIGHNVTYDLRVISKSLRRYSIDVPDFNYCCTLYLSRRMLNFQSYKLENIANKLGIEYNPHNAIEDARAAQELFEYINKKRPVTARDVKGYHYVPKVVEKYDPKLSTNINNLYGIIRVLLFSDEISRQQFNLLIEWYNENQKFNQYLVFHRINLQLKNIVGKGYLTGYDKNTLADMVDYVPVSSIYNQKTLKVQVLHGIINAITADNRVTLEELNHLKNWLKRNNILKGSYLYDNILNITEKHLKNGYMSINDEKDVSKIFENFINPNTSMSHHLKLKNKTFCLTGNFEHANRDDITKKLEKEGMVSKKTVTQNLDYLFVGDMGSSSWKYGNSGTKIVKAQKLQHKGSKIKIINEKNLFKELENR